MLLVWKILHLLRVGAGKTCKMMSLNRAQRNGVPKSVLQRTGEFIKEAYDDRSESR